MSDSVISGILIVSGAIALGCAMIAFGVCGSVWVAVGTALVTWPGASVGLVLLGRRNRGTRA